ncbi:ribonuclease H-like domain-containing protein [Tricladium varicosporioides]|nr:ribonuclease H-like domain-containing protein [Hymenoscyphus varicosporioides]
MSSASKKRKFNDGTPTSKFYGVKAGKIPGVYQTWMECQEMITGFRGAVYKSFPSQSEAQDFVAGKLVAGGIKGDKYYGVAVGHKTGVFQDWGEVQELIQGVKGPKYKKFVTKAEAEEFVNSGGKMPKTLVEEGEPSMKKARTGKTRNGVLKVWTDGSSRGNGRRGALAGVGVWFGKGDIRNVSEPLVGSQQTNQRAELTAIQRALEGVDIKQNLEIITDSNYAINCSTVWYKNWERNDWRTSDNKAVTNKDLVVEIRKLLNEREKEGAETEFTWIKGHDNDPGNEAADRLAVAGALMSRG